MKPEEKAEIIKYRIELARQTVTEVDTLIQNNLFNTAANRIYYSCFYAVSALLVKFDIKAQTHSGIRQMFGKHFIKTGRISQIHGKYYSYFFDMRQSGDYEDFVNYTIEDIRPMVSPAKALISEIENLLKNPR